jgi:type II secretory pathway component PulF
MFALPALIWAVFIPSLKQGLPNPIPAYEKILLDLAVFCGDWRWLLALPIVGLGLLFAIAERTASRARG